ncbi:MAG: Peptidase family M50 [Firmicutes bacterium ADurb.Bin193]|nr:MAG: Peptidase family M50 [Firmicutes bacterium ADurb.Bin193]
MLRNSSLLEWILVIPALLLSFSIHELCHGLAAYALGDDTAKLSGRLSLNPLRHIDPIGVLMILTIGFGWAKPVPVNTRGFADPKRGMALTALAGPMSNVVLAFLSGFALVLTGLLVLHNGELYVTSDTVWATLLIKLFVYNCSIAMFNFLPIPPLDGSKIVGALLPARLYFEMMKYEMYGMIVLVVLLYTGLLTPVLHNGVNSLMRLVFSLASMMRF